MDFGNPKKLRFLTICILFRVLKRLEEEGGGGWHIVTDFVTRLMRPKYPLKKSDRRCTLTHLVNKKYDSFTFAIRITFEQVSKQRLSLLHTSDVSASAIAIATQKNLVWSEKNVIASASARKRKILFFLCLSYACDCTCVRNLLVWSDKT